MSNGRHYRRRNDDFNIDVIRRPKRPHKKVKFSKDKLHEIKEGFYINNDAPMDSLFDFSDAAKVGILDTGEREC